MADWLTTVYTWTKFGQNFVDSTYTWVTLFKKVQKGYFINYLSDLSLFIEFEEDFEFWTIFGTYFFNSTYTRIDLYASIYGNLYESSRQQLK
jgi:hypothetical protein